MGNLLAYTETVELLQKHEITLPLFRLVQTVDEAVAAADTLGYPLVLKAVSADLTHKSEYGLVKLGLNSAEAVKSAATQLLSAVNWGNVATLEGILVQTMAAAGVEMIVGMQHDPQFGPVVALGAGGVLVELLDDAVLRLPPITLQQAYGMIAQSKAQPLLQGYRGKISADIPALAHLLVNISHLAQAQENCIASLDLNPVIVHPQGEGISVVDIRIQTR